jgi:hypothetical protein
MDWAVAVRDNPAIQMDAKSKLRRVAFVHFTRKYNFDESIRRFG